MLNQAKSGVKRNVVEKNVAQGYAGVISVTLNALIMVLWYLRFGRIFHLIVAHYLYDALQLGLVIILMRLGGWRM